MARTAQVGGLILNVDRLIADKGRFPDRVMARTDFLDFRSHDRGWSLDNGGSIGPKQLIDLAETCEGDYTIMASREPEWSSHIARAQRVSLSEPILVTEDGSIIDGAHRVTKMFIEHVAEIPAKVVGRDEVQTYRVVEPKEHDIAKEKPEVRIATVADAAEIARIQHESWLATYPNEVGGISREDIERYLKSVDQQTASWQRELRDEGVLANIRTFILEDAQKTLGFCRVGKTAEFGLVDSLYLDPAYIGKGIGGEVFRRGLEWLDADTPIQLKVASYNNQAIRFYERFGFRNQGGAKPLRLSDTKVIPITLMVRDVVEK